MPTQPEAVCYSDRFETRRADRRSQARWGAEHYFVSETRRDKTLGFDFQDCGDGRIVFDPCLVAVLDEQLGRLRRIRS